METKTVSLLPFAMGGRIAAQIRVLDQGSRKVVA
jgi:hypothetical protein